MRLTLIYDGAKQVKNGRAMDPLGALRLDIVVPPRMVDGPFRDLKLWFVDQYDRLFHGGVLEKSRKLASKEAREQQLAQLDREAEARGEKRRSKRQVSITEPLCSEHATVGF